MPEPLIQDVERLATAIQRELEGMVREGQLTNIKTNWQINAEAGSTITVETRDQIDLVVLAYGLLKSGAF